LLITTDNKNKSSLRPGIYLLVVDQGFDLGLVIHWSEPGCYEENASLQHKNNMIYLHRYYIVINVIFFSKSRKSFKSI
jgi:hypothetical protein